MVNEINIRIWQLRGFLRSQIIHDLLEKAVRSWPVEAQMLYNQALSDAAVKDMFPGVKPLDGNVGILNNNLLEARVDEASLEFQEYLSAKAVA